MGSSSTRIKVDDLKDLRDSLEQVIGHVKLSMMHQKNANSATTYRVLNPEFNPAIHNRNTLDFDPDFIKYTNMEDNTDIFPWDSNTSNLFKKEQKKILFKLSEDMKHLYQAYNYVVQAINEIEKVDHQLSKNYAQFIGKGRK